MDQTNTSTKMNASLFTDDEGESTDTADSSEQEYRYSLRLLYNNQIICTWGQLKYCYWYMTHALNVPFVCSRQHDLSQSAIADLNADRELGENDSEEWVR